MSGHETCIRRSKHQACMREREHVGLGYESKQEPESASRWRWFMGIPSDRSFLLGAYLVV